MSHWYPLWICWMLLGLGLAGRSLLATNLEPPPPHPSAALGLCLSGNGQRLAYQYQPPGRPHTLVRLLDIDQGRWQVLAPEANDNCQQPCLDELGQTVAFSSSASNLTPGDSNGVSDIFLYQGGRLQRILPPNPRPGLCSSYDPSLSRDGRQLAFLSYGLVDSGTLRGRNVCLWDGSQVRSLPDDTRGRGPVLGAASFSPAGDRIAMSQFAYDMVPNRAAIHYDIYLMPLNPRAPWPPAEPELPLAYSQGLGQVNRWAWNQPRLRRLWPLAWLSHPPHGGPSNANSYQPVLLEQECLFASLADNLVEGDHNHCHDIFVRSLDRPQISPLLGRFPNDSSFEPAASRDGRWVAFTSYASDLVAQDKNGHSDVFLFDRHLQKILCLSLGLGGPCHSPSISSDGSRVAFFSGHQPKLWQRGRGFLPLP